jgi:pimeloyl-ACP methyl ester carboxylesterase
VTYRGLRVLLLAPLVVLGSCVSSGGAEFVAMESPDRYFDQVVSWEECGAFAECATVVAPLDWGNLDRGEDIELAVSRRLATKESQGSLVVNPGGPGVSGFDYVRDAADFLVGPPLRESFDLVGWDPRGVNQSSAVSCAKNDAELDAFFFGELTATPDTPEWKAELEEEAVRFGQACLTHTGPLLEFVDTLSTVYDLDLLRHLLGDDQLNYLGYSYGTLIGALYIDEFPQRVGRIVLDGPIDPAASQFELVVNQHRGFEQALIAYLEDCVSLGRCPFAGGVEDQLIAVSSLYDRLEATPLRHLDGRLVDHTTLRIAMVRTLYSPNNWGALTQLFVEVSQGLTDTAMMLVDSYYDRPNGRYANNKMQAFIAINCLDHPVESDPGVLENQALELREAAPYTARPRGYGDVVCQNWPFPPRLTKKPVSGFGAETVLVVGTTGDPATPYNWSISLADQLESARHITFVAEGHLAYNKDSPCINNAVEAYFVEGILPIDGLRCES